MPPGMPVLDPSAYSAPPGWFTAPPPWMPPPPGSVFGSSLAMPPPNAPPKSNATADAAAPADGDQSPLAAWLGVPTPKDKKAKSAKSDPFGMEGEKTEPE